MRSVAISTVGVLALLCLGAKPQPKPKVIHEKMPDRPPSGRRVRIQTPVWGASWDWNQDVEGALTEITRSVHRGLYRIGPTGSLEKDLADSETASTDARVWTFRIRSGIRWSDGASLTAQHFVDGVLRAVDPTVTKIPEGLLHLSGVEDYHLRKTTQLSSIRVVSERVFEVSLSQPDPLFPLKWLDPRLMPARGDLAALNSKSYGFEPEKMAFLGRLMLKDSRPGLRTLLVLNPQALSREQNDALSIQRVELWHTPNLSQTRSLFDRGHLDLTLSTLTRAKTGQIRELPTTHLSGLVPVSNRAKNRWASLAVSSALDRSRLPALTPSLDWVPNVLWDLQGVGPYPSDAHLDTLSLNSRPSLAKALLKQAGGFSKEKPLRLSLEGDSSAPLLVALQKQLSSALEIPVRILSSNSKAHREPADWVLQTWKTQTWSIEDYLEDITGDSSWNQWNEIPLSEPTRITKFLEKTKNALVENPKIIPLGFAHREVRVKNYVNPLAVLGTGELDFSLVSYDPKSLERPRKKQP